MSFFFLAHPVYTKYTVQHTVTKEYTKNNYYKLGN